jgi:putative methyltransferase (TIGR04325 family)
LLELRKRNPVLQEGSPHEYQACQQRMLNSGNFARSLLPPVFLSGLRRLRNLYSKGDAIRFVGDYSTWAQAEQASTGYAATNILERTRCAMLKVKKGEVAYARDSVVFDQVSYPFPVLAGLLRARSAEGSRLSVLDFGGSLGTTYFQCRDFLSPTGPFRWNVVEQPEHAKCGREEFADEQLQFYTSIEECLTHEQPNVLLLSGVIQCLPEPYRFLADALGRGFPHIIVDRTAFFCGDRDLLTVQHVPEWIYQATYPAWFLCEKRFLQSFRERYRLVASFPASDAIDPEKGSAQWKGFLFEIRSSRPAT